METCGEEVVAGSAAEIGLWASDNTAAFGVVWLLPLMGWGWGGRGGHKLLRLECISTVDSIGPDWI